MRRPHPRPRRPRLGPVYTATGARRVITRPYTKVMIIAEENEEDSAVIGSSSAPYLTSLAHSYGNATNMQAGYPVELPLARGVHHHHERRPAGDLRRRPAVDASVVRSTTSSNRWPSAGLQWREYAESMTPNCRGRPTAPARSTWCGTRRRPTTPAKRRAAPRGTSRWARRHQVRCTSALAAGLPDYSFVTPNACDDMHGAPSCTTSLVKRGDQWLARWMPQIIASSDFQAARLVVIITWDEGSATSNHIPTLVVAQTVRGVASSAALTHCSTLRASEEVLGLPLLGCAASATSLRSAFDF